MLPKRTHKSTKQPFACKDVTVFLERTQRRQFWSELNEDTKSTSKVTTAYLWSV
ncbi:621_t:CDS:2 [Gigaspora rosea]|nr:621_t:CDS:2 [Gigaspora rosea]